MEQEKYKILDFIKKHWKITIISFSIPITIFSITIIINLNMPPPFELSYKLIEESREENGLYQNIFEISVKRPGGNFQKGYEISKNIKADCSWLEDTNKSESASNNGRQLFEISSQNIKCISKSSIIDNGKLFIVRGVN